MSKTRLNHVLTLDENSNDPEWARTAQKIDKAIFTEIILGETGPPPKIDIYLRLFRCINNLGGYTYGRYYIIFFKIIR